MTLNKPMFAIIDPFNGDILGNGDAPAIYNRRPDRKEVSYVRCHCGCLRAKVVRVRIVEEKEGAE